MSPKDRLINLLNRLIDKGSQQQFNLLFHRYHEADIADVLEQLPTDRKTLFFSRILTSETVDVFEEMDMESQIDIIQNFKIENAAELIEKMEKDDAVDLLEALLDEDQSKAKQILTKMDLNDQIELNRLLNYKDDSTSAILDGALVDTKGQNVISYGEVIKTNTIGILAKTFKLKNPMTILKVEKKL